MAASSNNAAAQMIGAQLQSLLKIPPIKKAETPVEAERKLSESSRKSALPKGGGGGVYKPPPLKLLEEKENKSNKSGAASARTEKSCDSAAVPRDRFGRPFQSLERQRREPEAGLKRFNTSNPFPRENRPESFNKSNEIRSLRSGGRGRGHQIRPPPPPEVKPTLKAAPRPNEPMQPTESFAPAPEATDAAADTAADAATPGDDRELLKESPVKYECPPRFIAADAKIDPEIAEILAMPECPVDILTNAEHMHEFHLPKNMYLWSTLSHHGITDITRLNPKFARAKFYCTVCNYHMDTLVATLTHLVQDRHFMLEKLGLLNMTLRNLPGIPPDHESYLTDLVLKTSKLVGMSSSERNQRLDIVRRLNAAITANKLDCHATMFGSTLPGFGFRNSNVNININVGGEASSTPIIENGVERRPSTPRTPTTSNITNIAEFSGVANKLVTIIKELPHVKESSVKEVYTPKCYSIHFFEEKTQAPCIVHFNNTSAVLAAQLFAEYDKVDPRVKPLVLCFRHLARVCEIDDQEKGFLPAHCYTIMVIYYLQREGTLPILHRIPKISRNRPFATAEHAKRHWISRHEGLPQRSVGDLWNGLLKFYGYYFSYRDCIITVMREDSRIDREEKQWNRRISVEDPIISKSNLARTITNVKICDYIVDRFKLAAVYFLIPRTESGPLYDGIFGKEVKFFGCVSRRVEVNRRNRLPPLPHEVGYIRSPTVCQATVVEVCTTKKCRKFVDEQSATYFRDCLFKDEYYYDFKAENFSDGTTPPIICKSCATEGHFRSNCPDETVPPYLPVEYPSPLTLSRLSSAININFAREAIDDHDISIRKNILREVKALLLPVFPTVALALFGSTLNGFGMHTSDVDMCLTFLDVIVPPGEKGIRCIEVFEVLEKTVAALKSCGNLTDILSIGSAKVPIVKFRHMGYRADGDISLYNSLCTFNTELLRSYADFDSRVAPLGIFLKKLVKLCDIGDASKGSLSSYCYILMLIHFLQNHTIPVLPVLQEMYSKDEDLVHVETFVINYQKDLNLVRKCWDGFGKNKESVSQLWLAFLNYYVEKFDNETYVVTISQSEPLTRQEKCWHTEGLAIEDPFDKTHNLGSGLTRRMSVHILRTFQKCRKFFHQSTDHLPNDVRILDHYFEVQNIREGNPPIDRQCRLCSRIGHIARNCTYVSKSESEAVPANEQQNNPPVDVKNGPVEPHEEQHQKSPTKVGPLNYPEQRGIQQTAQEALDDPDSLRATDPAVVLYSKLPNGGITPMESEIRVRSSAPDRSILNLFSNKSLMPKPSPVKMSEVPVEVPSKKEEPPVKELVFFGDIGGPNPEGERIQAMLRKNEGVTFTFELNQQRPVQAEVETPKNPLPQEVPHQPNVIVRQPPPGFCPPGMIVPNTMAMHPGLSYITGQMPSHMLPIAQAQPPPTQSYGHNATVPLQAGVPVVTAQMENRSHVQVNGDLNEVIGSVTAPPPGFAPLPSTVSTNTVVPPVQQQPEMVQSYHQPFTVGPNMGVYTVAPVDMHYQQLNGYAPTPPAPEITQPVVGYRPVDNEDGTRTTFDGNSMATGRIGGTNAVTLVPHPNMQHIASFPGRSDHMVSRGAVNGHPENGEEQQHMMQQPTAMFMKGPVASGEPGPGYNAEYGGLMPAGNPSVVSSYGLSLSQAHHSPVVSALQMQHSQHHPVPLQGGHFHPQVRPYMPVGNYGGGGYPFPQMQVPPPQLVPHQGLHRMPDNTAPVHGTDAPAWK